MIEELHEKYKKCSSVSTDTRSISNGALFFALKGPNFNANKLAEQALESGAKYVVIDDEQFKKDDRFILVDDCLNTLQQLANYHRKQLDIPFIAITGSNGKTTTKELMREVLAQKYVVYATLGNFNNHIGVPLTILSINESVEIAIIEMGANKLGDIAQLCEIAAPTHGMITNIGKAHVGNFGGFDNIIRAKSELYQYLIENDGQVWINSNQEILANMSKRFNSPLFYPNRGDYYHAHFVEATPYVLFETENKKTVQSQLVGAYNFENIAAALCVGKFFDVDEEKANEAIRNYLPSNNRSQVIDRKSNTIIMDAYNANPSSMEVAIDNFGKMKGERKVVVLGDMYELGEESDSEHERLGEIVAAQNFDHVFFCGKLIKLALNTCPNALYFEEKKELGQALRQQKYQDTLMLLKASRGIGLETILEDI
ncbi:MAG: UDP-N-acetylmuramoyl-tripeptide--D-alanyl-D-alanine ligase [Cyclobacteriaceae bacterium]|nr:UDP-N-acetylmuramoyl-tripeptide--D-alanyl-D-alanine ligase [Cyclobacteriaceae bacterium]